MTLSERLFSATVLSIGMTLMATAVVVHFMLLLVLLPSRVLRIKSCNYFGKVVGPTMMWLSGSPITWYGTEHLDPNRPAIYISNHTSIVDILLGIWLSPVGTVGVAKKQVVYYPFFGQLYWLSGHLRIDRGKSRAAVQSLKDLAKIVHEHGLSIYIWPEGTRSRDGRLLPFKKGIVHLAKQTGLPIIPVVVQNAHQLWEKSSLAVRRTELRVDILPPVDTTDWSLDTLQEHLDELHGMFVAALPESQRPLELARAA